MFKFVTKLFLSDAKIYPQYWSAHVTKQLNVFVGLFEVCRIFCIREHLVEPREPSFWVLFAGSFYWDLCMHQKFRHRMDFKVNTNFVLMGSSWKNFLSNPAWFLVVAVSAEGNDFFILLYFITLTIPGVCLWQVPLPVEPSFCPLSPCCFYENECYSFTGK